MKVSIITIYVNQPGSVTKLYESIDSVHDVELVVFRASQDDDTKAECLALSKQPGVLIAGNGRNMGCARYWNDGLVLAQERNADVIIITNNDIWFSPGDVDKMALKSIQCPGNYMISVAGIHVGRNQWEPSHGHCCFALNPISLEKIGYFDENFWPAYLEDCDYWYRSTLAGLHEENCNDTMIYHVGSATVAYDRRLAARNRITQGKNFRYYQKKWGDINGMEKHKFPFNNPGLSFFIPAEERHNPYPDYYRTDIPRL